jgi:hypothetical protein
MPNNNGMSREKFIAWLKHFAWLCFMEGAGQETPFYSWPPTTDVTAIKSQLDAVKFLDAHPNATPEENHNNWTYYKLKQGWTWGPEKDNEAKTHPDLIPYEQLPEIERKKDEIDIFAYQAGRLFWSQLRELSPLEEKREADANADR